MFFEIAFCFVRFPFVAHFYIVLQRSTFCKWTILMHAILSAKAILSSMYLNILGFLIKWCPFLDDYRTAILEICA